MITRGTHKAVARGVQWGTAETGARQVVVEFEIVDGEDAGSTISWFGFWTEKTENSTLRALRACGWTGDDLTNLGPMDNEVELVVQHEPDKNGTPRAKVRWVNAPGAGGGIVLKAPMAPDELRRFAAEMRSKARSVPEVKRTSPATSSGGSTPPSAAVGAMDDIPF